jgi:hypothetical protein
MATTAQNNLLFAIGGNPRGLRWPIISSGSFDINQGDLCWFDTSVYQIKSLDSDAHAQYLAGVASQTSFINPYGTKEYFPDIVVYFGAVFYFGTVSGDTWQNGTSAYFSTDAQHVTAVSASHVIGYAYLNTTGTIGTAPTLAGGSGVNVPIFVVAQYPTALV